MHASALAFIFEQNKKIVAYQEVKTRKYLILIINLNTHYRSIRLPPC